MTELEMFNLIMYYFPHRSDDPELVLDDRYGGGVSIGGPFTAFGYIIIDFISKGGTDTKDINSTTHMVNDIYNTDLIKGKTCSTSAGDDSCEEAFSFIIEDGLKNLWPEDRLKPLFKFEGKALEKVNYWLKQDDRFNKVLFG